MRLFLSQLALLLLLLEFAHFAADKHLANNEQQ